MTETTVSLPFKWNRTWQVALSLLVVFAILGVLTRYSFLQSFDLRFTRETQETSNPVLDALMRAATFLGNAASLIVVAALAALGLWRAGRLSAVYFVLLSLIGLPLDMLLKSIWDRARPDASLVHVAIKYSGASFPSGHAVGGTLLYGTLATLTWIHLPKGRLRLVATVGLALLPLAIDASRVYLGAHWLSDVVGGTAFALALLLILIRWYGDRLKATPQASVPAKSSSAP